MNAHSRKKRRDSNLHRPRWALRAKRDCINAAELHRPARMRGVTLATIHEEGESLRAAPHADRP